MFAETLAEVGADVSGETPKAIDPELLRRVDLVVTLGREARVDVPDGVELRNWDTDEPSERGIDGIERMRLIRDDVASTTRPACSAPARLRVRSTLEALAALTGDVDAEVEAMARDLTSAYQLLRIAERLLRDDRQDDAHQREIEAAIGRKNNSATPRPSSCSARPSPGPTLTGSPTTSPSCAARTRAKRNLIGLVAARGW